MEIMNYTIVITPDETGGYVVTCPALPGLVTEGESIEEARDMARDAIGGYLESLRMDGEPLPVDTSVLLRKLLRGAKKPYAVSIRQRFQTTRRQTLPAPSRLCRPTF